MTDDELALLSASALDVVGFGVAKAQVTGFDGIQEVAFVELVHRNDIYQKLLTCALPGLDYLQTWTFAVTKNPDYPAFAFLEIDYRNRFTFAIEFPLTPDVLRVLMVLAEKDKLAIVCGDCNVVLTDIATEAFRNGLMQILSLHLTIRQQAK